MAVIDFNIKQNDTAPALRVVLRRKTTGIVDLTTASSVLFLMRPAAGGAATVSAAATFDTPRTSGGVRYNWAGANTVTAGDFDAEFQITWADATVETFPNVGYIRVRVTDDVG